MSFIVWVMFWNLLQRLTYEQHIIFCITQKEHFLMLIGECVLAYDGQLLVFVCYLVIPYFLTFQKADNGVKVFTSWSKIQSPGFVTITIVWIHQLLLDLNVPILLLSVIYCNNEKTISIASNFTFHERTKHIKINCLILLR